ncbi:MAG: Rrf2 family transcriptional regulator [Candidatus Aminicenantes bacterium]|nr:Rrf2 family transcriptional regulator [Candidatus Aminicenantes bacterium]
MIKMSTKGRYGTRLMLQLAHHYGDKGQAVILRSVAENETISIRYLEQIIIPLKVSKLVKSIRGAGGGYSLARPPDQIKISEILHTLEGSCCLVECIEDEDFCPRKPYCATFEIWNKATQLLKGYFDNLTLQDVVEIDRKKKKAKPK